MPVKFKNIPSKPKGSTPDPEPQQPPQPYLQISEFAQNSILYHAHRHTAKETNPRPHRQIHASDLDPERNWCPRECALHDKHGTKRPKGFLATATKVVFDFGHSASDILRKCLPPEQVWGNWKCLACGHDMKHQYTPKMCWECKAKHPRVIEYREVFARCPDTGILNSFDLMVDLLGNGTKTIVETKSEGGDSFKKRTKATFSHDWRTKMYLRNASVTPWLQGKGVNVQEARIVYISKEGFDDAPQIKKWGLHDWKKSPFKEYRVTRDDTFLENKIELVRSYLKWKNAWDAGVALELPDRVCSTAQDTTAKSCPCVKVCFQ